MRRDHARFEESAVTSIQWRSVIVFALFGTALASLVIVAPARRMHKRDLGA
jgi:hypothetical protein